MIIIDTDSIKYKPFPSLVSPATPNTNVLIGNIEIDFVEKGKEL